MAAELPDGCEAECRRLVIALVQGAFETLRDRGWAGRCKPEDLARVVKEYGRTLCVLPDDAFALAETYQVEGERRWFVDLPLWTEEEGRSDLQLTLVVSEGVAGPVVEIDDLRVP